MREPRTDHNAAGPRPLAVSAFRAASALDALLLAVDGRFDAAGGTRIFPRHLAEGGAGGLLLLERRQRLSEPQQRVGGLARFVEFGGHPEEGFRGVAILLALEIALAEPVLRIGDQGVARIFHREVAHGFLGQRIVLALHVADAEIEFVLRGCRRRQSRQRGSRGWAARRRRYPGCRITRTAGVGEIERLAGSAAAGRADRGFGGHGKLTAAERARRTRGGRILAGVERVAAPPTRGRRRAGRLLYDRRRCRDLRLIIGRLPIGRAGLRRGRGAARPG